MDYSKYYEFPFPSDLSETDLELKDYFMSLSDEDQLSLLNGSRSYDEFHEKVYQSRMRKTAV